jgi:hypothetical protein
MMPNLRAWFVVTCAMSMCIEGILYVLLGCVQLNLTFNTA